MPLRYNVSKTDTNEMLRTLHQDSIQQIFEDHSKNDVFGTPEVGRAGLRVGIGSKERPNPRIENYRRLT